MRYTRCMTTIEKCTSPDDWEEYVLAGGGHPLQLWGWGELKAAHGWRAERVFVREGERVVGAAQLLIRPLPGPMRCLVYVPRGPVVGEASRAEVLDALAGYAKKTHHPVAISIEPDWKKMPAAKGWRMSPNTILIPDTLILDLARSEDELLGAMAKKTRQYIRKSTKEDIEIRRISGGPELEKCLDIYEDTARRAGFAIHGREYYRDLHRLLGDHSLILAAFHAGAPVAFLWLAISSATAFELYGGVNETGQQLRANYALKWRAIQRCKEWGIGRYDFNGLLNDGISTFKRGFASHETTLAGTYDKPLSPLYPLWTHGLPHAKKIVRKLKRLS